MHPLGQRRPVPLSPPLSMCNTPPLFRSELRQLAYDWLPPVRARACASPWLCGRCCILAAAQVLTWTNFACPGAALWAVGQSPPSEPQRARSLVFLTCGHRPRISCPFVSFFCAAGTGIHTPGRGRPTNNENGSIPTVPQNTLVAESLWGLPSLKYSVKKKKKSGGCENKSLYHAFWALIADTP